MKKLKIPHRAAAVIFISSFCLISAYIIEYWLHIPACPLCIYQRFPYVILIFIGIIALASNENYNQYLITTVIAAIILAAYHAGIERGFFELSSLCKPLISIADNISVQDFKKLLYSKQTVLCNKPAIVIFSLSLTEWNLLVNIGLLGVVVKTNNKIDNSVDRLEKYL